MRVQHRTGYRYDGEVTASFNEARMTPLTCPRQRTLDTRIDISPSAQVQRYTDYWGSAVTAFDVQALHRELTVTATSIVESSSAPEERHDATWEDVRAPAVSDRFAELLEPTPATSPDEELRHLAHEWSEGLAPSAAAHALATRLRGEMEYEQDVTHVHTLAVDTWKQRRGVCQDMAHVLLALLRARGIPARYVSGYLHPKADAGLGETVAGESHAWVEWWDGSWTAQEPTNDLPVSERHVLVARGREYADVPPLKGIYSGPACTALGVQVEITRLG
jgi:transglutaminase-like putative cysteine protease